MFSCVKVIKSKELSSSGNVQCVKKSQPTVVKTETVQLHEDVTQGDNQNLPQHSNSIKRKFQFVSFI